MAPPKEWWDIAYNELVAQDGTVLEGRGLLYRSGAQGSTATNRAYIAIGLLLGDGDGPTDEMIQAGRATNSSPSTMCSSNCSAAEHTRSVAGDTRIDGESARPPDG